MTRRPKRTPVRLPTEAEAMSGYRAFLAKHKLPYHEFPAHQKQYEKRRRKR